MSWRHSAEHDADHGHPDEGFGDAAVALEIAGQAAVLADPAQRAFNNPSLRQHDKAMLVAAAHDLNGPAARAGHGRRHPRPLISGITDNPLDEREQPSRLAQHRLGAVAILHIGRMHHYGEQQAQGVGQNMAFAAEGLLARVGARWVERGPPFCAPFAV